MKRIIFLIIICVCFLSSCSANEHVCDFDDDNLCHDCGLYVDEVEITIYIDEVEEEPVLESVDQNMDSDNWENINSWDNIESWNNPDDEWGE